MSNGRREGAGLRTRLLGLPLYGVSRDSPPRHAESTEFGVAVDGLEYGRGSALNVGAAREIAAEQALRTLWAARR